MREQLNPCPSCAEKGRSPCALPSGLQNCKHEKKATHAQQPKHTLENKRSSDSSLLQPQSARTSTQGLCFYQVFQKYLRQKTMKSYTTATVTALPCPTYELFFWYKRRDAEQNTRFPRYCLPLSLPPSQRRRSAARSLTLFHEAWTWSSISSAKIPGRSNHIRAGR